MKGLAPLAARPAIFLLFLVTAVTVLDKCFLGQNRIISSIITIQVYLLYHIIYSNSTHYFFNSPHFFGLTPQSFNFFIIKLEKIDTFTACKNVPLTSTFARIFRIILFLRQGLNPPRKDQVFFIMTELTHSLTCSQASAHASRLSQILRQETVSKTSVDFFVSARIEDKYNLSHSSSTSFKAMISIQSNHLLLAIKKFFSKFSAISFSNPIISYPLK